GSPAAAELADDGDDALDLVAFPDRSCTRTRRFAAYVDDRCAFARHTTTGLSSFGGIRELAPVRKAVGSRVDDAHHLRLVETHRPLTQLQRWPRPCQRFPLSRHVLVVEPILEPFDRDQLGRFPGLAVDLDELDGSEPVEAARKPGNLSIVAEG